MKEYYLAYGSNLNLKQMKYRCKTAIPIGTTILHDYRLVYKGSCDKLSYLTIEKNEGSYVPLGIYEITSLDKLPLDIYEGYPNLYHKEYVDIKIDGKIEKALIYIMNDEFNYYTPSNKYIETCIQGYKDFGFDKKLLNEALKYSIKNKPKKKRLIELNPKSWTVYK